MKKVIQTTNAPAAIGTYSQGIAAGNLVFVSGQIPLRPEDGSMPEKIDAQIEQVIANIKAMCEAAEASLDDIVRITVYMVDLSHFALVNAIMEKHFSAPYPARAAVEVKGLPKNAQIEMDAIIQRT